MAKLLDALSEHVLLCDGGMGSRVQAMDLEVDRDYWGQENCTEVLNLSRPDIGFVDLARGMGVDGVRCETAEDFDRAFAGAMGRRGPFLIEAAMP